MSDLAPSPEAVSCTCDPLPAPTIEALPGRGADLGGLAIRRLLPRSRRRLVGAWCFLDSFGPLGFSFGKPMDVPPHPHIGLQTVSWLLEGAVLHNDSLGLQGLARPGVLNLMTAGRGIAHSEETPPGETGRLHGVQLWVALPAPHRGTEPAFESHAALPALPLEGGRATVILGELAGVRSPARVFSPIVGAELRVEAGSEPTVPLDPGFEHALVPLSGGGVLEGQRLSPDTLYYLGSGRRELRVVSRGAPLVALLLGGAPFEERIVMWWNFVAGSFEEIAAARADWEAERRFGTVSGYRGDRLAAPALGARPITPSPAAPE